MDLAYRTELRELNELNFARFDAKVGERLAELRTDIERQKYVLLRWMFAFWCTTLLGILGLYLGR